MGMPFPNPTDPELCERMRYLDASTSGLAKSPQPAGQLQAPDDTLIACACWNRSVKVTLGMWPRQCDCTLEGSRFLSRLTARQSYVAGAQSGRFRWHAELATLLWEQRFRL